MFLSHEQAILDYLEEDELDRCLRNVDWKKAVANIMGEIFSEADMISCSVTAKNTTKVGLDQDKVDALIGYMKSKFSTISTRVLREKMGTKLRDVRRSVNDNNNKSSSIGEGKQGANVETNNRVA